MKKLILSLSVIAILSCNKAKESAQDAITDAMEQTIENETGTEIDLPDSDEMDNNAGFVNYKSENRVYLNDSEKLFASVIFQKDNDGLALAFQLTGDNGTSFSTAISHVPEDFSLPLKAKFSTDNSFDGTNPSAMIMFLNASEDGMTTSEIPFEGEVTVTKLSKDLIEFEIEGKGSNITDAESPSNWKAISGNVKIITPIILSSGIDKNAVLK